MDIQTIGSIGEFVGSIAVLATLIYLSMQTRQSIKVARQRSNSDILSRRQELQLLLTTNHSLNEIISKGCAGEEMTSLEAQRFTSYFLTYLHHTQDAYMQYKVGLISKEFWEADLSTITGAFTQAGFQDWWKHGKQFVTAEFASVIEDSSLVNIVLYDPETQTWSAPVGGVFGKDASIGNG
jgi:hypothetical protein